jgi:hypothetical protein
MRVLVVGTEPSGIEKAAGQLHDAGHDVVQCHGRGETPFPCAGLDEERGCPLEGAPVDVTVTVRTHPWPRPTPYEDGSKCALRRHVPLVVLGTALHPFEGWAIRAIDDEDALVEACEDAARAPLFRHGEVATKALRDMPAFATRDPADVSVEVHHRAGRLVVDLHLPWDVDDQVRSSAVARVLTVLRELDPYALGIDISTT